jgi:DNA repair protein RadC
MEKNVEEGLAKLSPQSHNPPLQIQKKKKTQNDFDWLYLNTKNEMLRDKLKIKLVQTINEFSNEKKLREVMGVELDEEDKISLEN